MGEENKKPRVAIDTNLVISGTISPHGYPANLLTTWTQGSFEWILTEETFAEIREVLSREEVKNKYHIDVAEAQSFLNNLAVGAELRDRRDQGALIKTLMKDYGLSKASVYRYLSSTATI